MTLPASGLISLTDVLNELKISNPGRASFISLGDNDVRALAGVPSGTISLSDLYGKSSLPPLVASGVDDNSSMNGNTTGTTYNGVSRPSVNPSGGSGGYTYAWVITGGDTGFSLTNSVLQSPNVSHSIGKFGYTGTCILSCTVTDNGGRQVTVNNIQCVYTA